MEAAIRGALEKAGIPGAQARRRIYDSARGALDRSLERQGITDAERIDEHRNRLEALIASIEAEWTPPSGAAVDFAVEPPVRPVASPAPLNTAATGPVAGGPGHIEPPWSATPSPAATTAPMVAPPSRPAGAPTGPGGDASLDIAPDADGHAAAVGSAPGASTGAEHPQHRPAAAPQAAKPAKKVKVPKPRAEKRRRGVFASIFSAAVMLSFLGIGIWWLIQSGALKSAAERDTSVPNPPPSLRRDDSAGGPHHLTPGAGFSGEWANVYTPGRDGAARVRGSASAEVIEENGGNVLRITSGNATGEVLVPLGAEVMQALAGRQSVLALTVRAASPDATQIYVRCEFSVLGDCGRHRFNVTYDTTDFLFNLDYDRALAPNQGGDLVINSDISGAGKSIDLLAVRIRALN